MTDRVFIIFLLTLFAFCLPAHSTEKQDTLMTERYSLYYYRDRINIDPDYLNNSLQIMRIKDILTCSPHIDSIAIYAYSSPEGSPRHNEWLSHKRAEAAREFILANLPANSTLKAENIILHPMGENWEALYEELKANYHLPNRDRVMKIMRAKVPTETKKWRLQNLDNNFTYNSHAGDETHVKVEVIYSDDNKPAADGTGNWIGLERSFGDGNAVVSSSLYCVSGSSAGKRKYFTYDLVNKGFSKGDGNDDVKPLHESTEVIVPIPQGAGQGECVWIYVDECTEASPAKDAKRSATIKVTCGKYVSGNFTPVGDALYYTVSQHKLFEVNSGTRTYCIEHEEEYLHNFDNDDSYEHNQTEYNGMAWGLNGVQLSNLYSAIHLDIPSGIINIILQIFGAESTEAVINNQLIEKGLNPKYDFYIPRDITNDELTIRGFSGYTFNQELATYIRSNGSTKIEGITLDETPQSAFAYCYNRNKRDRNGNVASQKWYMPAIDELEEIMTYSYLYFSDFHGQYYWSCQPAYEKYNMNFTLREQDFWGSWSESTKEGFFYTDNTSRSRATRVKIDETTGEFEDMISSASDVSGIQYGTIQIPFWNPGNSTFTLGDLNRSTISYDNHPGNKPRTEKCRVRAVYKP